MSWILQEVAFPHSTFWQESLLNIARHGDVTGEQFLKLAHSFLGYAVSMTDIYRPGWPITRKQTHRNKFEQNSFPQEQLKIHYHFLTICFD